MSTFMERVPKPKEWKTTETSATARLERWIKKHKCAEVSFRQAKRGFWVSLVWESRSEVNEQENVGATLDAAIHAALDAAEAER